MIETENTIKAIKLLRKYTDKRVILKDIKELAKDPIMPVPSSYLGAGGEDAENILIFLNYEHSDICEAIFIHEILHIILHHEGFPVVLINKSAPQILPADLAPVVYRIQALFSSVIDHPLVYKRMQENFELPFDNYFAIQVQQKIKRLKSVNPLSNITQFYFTEQQDILVGLEYFFYPQKFSIEILENFKRHAPEPYASCLSLYGKTRNIGFDTPFVAIKSANVIKEHIIKYGIKKSIKTINKIWEILEIVKGPIKNDSSTLIMDT